MWSAKKLPMRPEMMREVEGAKSNECAAGFGMIAVFTTRRRGCGSGWLDVGLVASEMSDASAVDVLQSVIVSPPLSKLSVVGVIVLSSSVILGRSFASMPES